MIYLRFIAPKLLPERDSLTSLLSDRPKMKFFSEAVIPPESNLIGRAVSGVRLFQREGVRLVDVIRGDASLRRKMQDVELQVGDRIILRTEMAELLSLQRTKSLKRVDQISAVQTSTVEVLIIPGCWMIGRSHSPIALLALLGIVGLAAFQVAPILLLAIVAVAIVLVTGCIDVDEAFAFVDGYFLVLIFAMLGVGAALEHTGRWR